MSDGGAAVWFYGWLRRHKTLNPHGKFGDYESAGADLVYSGWIRAFDRRGIDETTADDSSLEMQAEDKSEVYPEHHLNKLLKHAIKIMADRQRADEAARIGETRRINDEHYGREERLKVAWEKLPDSTKERYRDEVRSQEDSYIRISRFVDYLARHRWADAMRSRRLTTATK